ncbi:MULTISPECIES: hypothetical protein [Serratia]|uniref:hypothetical protein n=1 Tax=Serratia TaxID=613 RepID=UPI000744E832|nr:hypothetical protein [Serratia marcescens]CVE97409.1 Uncharacterised protein [Serratia marcescens]CVG62302.1 Uncharacterised protein [Serratia marcescens]
MTSSHGQSSAQGTLLPPSCRYLSYGMTEDAFEKLNRAKQACSLLDMLFAGQAASTPFPTGITAQEMAAMVAYLSEDLAFVQAQCAAINGEVVA